MAESRIRAVPKPAGSDVRERRMLAGDARLHSELWLPVLLVAAEVNPPSLTAVVVAKYAVSCTRRLLRANRPGKVFEAPGQQRMPQLATC